MIPPIYLYFFFPSWTFVSFMVNLKNLYYHEELEELEALMHKTDILFLPITIFT
jgi:hypothetical protein